MKRSLLVLPVLLVALGVAACSAAPGGDSSTPQGKRGGASSEAGSLQQFAACMREHGQNVPDPDPNSGNVAITPPAGDQAGWNTAMGACRQLMPNGGQPQAPDPQDLEGLRQYAACMREHGVEVTDPDPNTGNGQVGGRFANMSRNQIVNDPTYKAADAACKDKLPSAAPQKDNK